MTRLHRIVIGFLILISAAAAASAQEIPQLTQPVNDFAHVIDAASAQELDRQIRALKNTTGDVVVVATVPTIKSFGSIEEYAVKMFENGGRGIGEKGKDNGLLLLVAVEDRKVRIETGYDVEGMIPDGFAGQTIREVIAPAFRAGRYGPGLVAATNRLINRIAEQRGVTLQNVPAATPVVERQDRRRRQTNIVPFLVIFFILLMASRNRRRRRRRWGGGPWSGWNSGVGPFGGGMGGFGGGFGGFGGGGGGFGGGGGGGFGGFGGGRSGGGGASGGW